MSTTVFLFCVEIQNPTDGLGVDTNTDLGGVCTKHNGRSKVALALPSAWFFKLHWRSPNVIG